VRLWAAASCKRTSKLCNKPDRRHADVGVNALVENQLRLGLILLQAGQELFGLLAEQPECHNPHRTTSSKSNTSNTTSSRPNRPLGLAAAASRL
jgi:hypothetical protein